MNVTRYLREESDPVLIGLIVVTAALLLAVWVLRRQEARTERRARRSGDRGGNGYSPADLRPFIPSGVAATADRPGDLPDDPHERWLLGLAGPFVEPAGLSHATWDLGVQDSPEHHRHLARLLEQSGVRTRADWEREVAALESSAPWSAPWTAAADDPSPWTAARLAMVLRLGVAAGHTTSATARRRLESAASDLRRRYTDWFGFADAFLAAAERLSPGEAPTLRATIRVLYAPGGPWSDVSWPR